MIYTQRPPRSEIHAARARKARAWAWPVRIMLVACIAAAIWQEPRLSPQAHSVMRDTADRAVAALETNDRVRGFIASFTGERSVARDVGLADKLSASLSR